MLRSLVLAVLVVHLGGVACKKVSDGCGHPGASGPHPVVEALFPAGEGPLVAIDQSHRQYHCTRPGRSYAGTVRVLEDLGFRVESVASHLDQTGADVLVLPPSRDLYTSEELTWLSGWVQDGGALVVLADHPPHQIPMNDVVGLFGMSFGDALVQVEGCSGQLCGESYTFPFFSIAVTTFGGVQVTGGDPLLVFGADAYSSAGRAEGTAQAIALDVGEGTVVALGESRVFSVSDAGGLQDADNLLFFRAVMEGVVAGKCDD